jgi:serine O-acetyltransferase
MKTRQLLDADWARLLLVSEQASRTRGFRSYFNPRFAPVAFIRIASGFEQKGFGRTARLVSLLANVLFGMEFSLKTPIGPGLVIFHANGIVMGARSLGANVTLYQQTTLGSRMADFSTDLMLRPVVEDGVTITAGAKILGPVVLGSNCVVGANAVVVRDVPPNVTVGGVPARVLRHHAT